MQESFLGPQAMRAIFFDTISKPLRVCAVQEGQRPHRSNLDTSGTICEF